MAKKLPPDAFDYYFSLGPGRSYQAVAAKYGASKRAVTLLAKRENWQRRLLEVEAKARERSDQRKVETIDEMNERHLKALKFLFAKAIENLQRAPLEKSPAAVRALEVVIRSERTIRGEPADRTALAVEDTIKREYERWLVHDDAAADTNQGEDPEGDDDEPHPAADASQ